MSYTDEISSAFRLLRGGQAAQAQRLAERMLSADLTREATWIVMIESLSARGLAQQAVAAALRAVDAVPRSERLQALLALSRLHAADLAGSHAAALELWARHPSDIHALTTLGQVLAALERHDLARPVFEQACAIAPKDPQLLFNLATSLRNFGEVERAERLYDEVIVRRPNDWEAYRNRGELRRQTPQSNHVREIQAALARTGPDWRGAVMLYFALGKEQEDLAEHDAAFRAYDAGARLRRRNMAYDVEIDLRRLDAIQATFSADWLGGREEGFPSCEPIFIFGLPRSGSTLLERMLGAHGAIYAAGELQNFGAAALRLADAAGKGRSDDLIGRTANLDPFRLGEAYLASTRPRTGGTPHFIDKLPNNFLYAGLIAAALPAAKMIHIHRDPRDAGYAMYKTLFKQAYPFSYDLRELGRYINAYQTLMRHWRALLPGRIIDVRYEDLVRAPEQVVGNVLEQCGLAFEPGCLSYVASPEASSTASSVQVRRPIYQTSVQAWRHHAHELAPLIEALQGSTPPGAPIALED